MMMMFLVRSPKLDDIFMDQEHNSMRNELGKKSWKYTLKGYISANKVRKKKMKTILPNTYMCCRLILRVLEPPFLDWSWVRTWRWGWFWRWKNLFLVFPWEKERAENLGEGENEIECDLIIWSWKICMMAKI